MSNTNEYEPCPFCGSDDIRFEFFGEFEGEPLPWVVCEDCESRATTDRTWNKRTPNRELENFKRLLACLPDPIRKAVTDALNRQLP